MARKLKGVPRNVELKKGLNKYSKSSMFHRKGKAQKLAKKTLFHPTQKKVATTTPVVKKFGKNAEPREIKPKLPRFYPTEAVRTPYHPRKAPGMVKLRPSVTPGTVLILLAGRFQGRRVVFLKQLKSGLLLVSGPFKLNGVPLRRVNQAYVIATSTKLDLPSLKLDGLTDDYFKKPQEKKNKGEKEFFANAEKKAPSTNRIQDQKTIDTSLMEVIKKTPQLKDYLRATFTLKKGQYPHAMKF